MTTNNVNVKIPAMLPTAPLPLNVVATNVMYMYSCSQCEFKTHVESLFKQHVDSVHLGIPNVPSNAVLGQNTSSAVITVTQPQTIVMASQLLSPVVTASTTTSSSTSSILSAVSNDKFHKCPKCNAMLPSKNQLNQHKRRVHGKAALAASATASATSGVTYVVSSQPPSTSNSTSVVATTLQPVSVLAAAAAAASATPVAAAAATSATPVVATSTNITGKKTYSCTACGYSTTRRDGLSQHYDSVHLKIKNHQCELCPYAASQKGTLNRHVKLRHKKKVTVVGSTSESTSSSSVLS